MAITKIADIIIPEVFVPYVIERTAEKSALVQSGIVQYDPELVKLAQGGGKLINVPFYKDLSGSDEVLEEAALTPDKITTRKDQAHILHRGKAWGVTDLAEALAGNDPMKAIADLVADFWNRKEQAILISLLNGVFGSATMANHVLDLGKADVTNPANAVLIDADAVIDASYLLGDAADRLTAIAMHSTIYKRLKKLQLLEYEADPVTGVKIPYYDDKRVIVDDICTVENVTGGKKYSTYLFGEGAVARADGSPKVPVETDRDSLAGEDYLINRRHFVLHARGIKWTGTPSGTTPSNTELATGTNWERVYDDKNIRLVKLVTNG